MTGRFAPTPSGRMHLGNLWSALCAWLSVRAQGGRLLLRMEDLDTQRTSAEFARQMREDLLWLGLDWDEEQTPQSQRSDAYQAVFDDLSSRGLIYPCYCSRADLHAADAPHTADGRYRYPGTCRGLTEAQRLAKHRPPAWRLTVPDRIFSVQDGVQGRYEENLAQESGDFIIRRADGVFAYQLAVVVDDIAGGVTEVVRGRDLLDSTPRQRWLYELLNAPPPATFHVPLLLAPDGRRLSKRERDLGLDSLRLRFTPEALLGRLAHMAGLLPQETPISAAELVPLFAWEKLPKGDIFLSEDF